MKSAMRMLGKRQDRSKRMLSLRLPNDITQKLLMAEVKPIKIPKCKDDRPPCEDG